MKTDLTDLSLEAQIAAVADQLRQLTRCGLQAEPDLHRYFKHRAFKKPAQRDWHYRQLLTIALLLLNGRKAEFERVLAAMKAHSVIFEPGDQVQHDGIPWVVKEILPEAKLLLKRGEGHRVALAAHCSPVLPTDPSPWPISADTAG